MATLEDGIEFDADKATAEVIREEADYSGIRVRSIKPSLGGTALDGADVIVLVAQAHSNIRRGQHVYILRDGSSASKSDDFSAQ